MRFGRVLLVLLSASFVLARCNCGNGPGHTEGDDAGQDAGPDGGDAGPDGGTGRLPDGGINNILPDGGICPAHQMACGSVCVNPRVDPYNCGGCGIQCTGATACSSGVCSSSCQIPLTICSNQCVDTFSDNANCGSCSSGCDAGQGCVNGTCQAAVVLGPPPASCANGGPPIFLDDAGVVDCAGNVAQRTFRWALCSCNSLSVSATFFADGFDSSQGPYEDGGIGAGVGTNGALKSTGPSFYVGGPLWASDGGIIQGNNLTILQDIHVGGPWTMGTATVSGDGFVTGNITASNPSSVAGVLNLETGATITGPFTAGSIVHGSVQVPPSCDCSAGQAVPVAAIVSAHAAQNDNALVSLDAGVFVGSTSAQRLDLPCGNYYLSAITTSNPVAIVAHGNVALYVGGDVTTNVLELTLDPTSDFDVFVAGSVCNSGGLRLGSPNYPAQMRLYAAGNGVSCGHSGQSINFTGPSTTFAGNLYAVNGYNASSASINYGSIFAGTYTNSAAATIHYDRAVLDQGNQTCQVPDGGTAGGCTSCRDCNNQACVLGQCSACTSNSDCCAPLICNQGSCQPAACASLGHACASASGCCSGLRCVDQSFGPCSGADAGCRCEPTLN